MLETGSGLGGGPMPTKKTPEGKVAVAARTDANNNLVQASKNYTPQQATGPQGMGTGGKL